MGIKAKKLRIFEFSLISGKMWFPMQQGFGYNTKYPRMRSDQKTYFLIHENKAKKTKNF